MKKVLFMFVAVLALVSCQKGAEKSSEATADSTKTEAVEEKTADATELVAPEKTGDIAEDLIAQAKFVLAKIKACKTADELSYKIPCSGVISRPAASTSCRSFFITSAGIHLRSTLTVRMRLRLRTMSIGA